MFTGIVEAIGIVSAIKAEGTNKHFTIESPITSELSIDQSVSHNGVCLTVVSIVPPYYTVTAIKETLVKSNLGHLRAGDKVNLERSMTMEKLLDGHIVLSRDLAEAGHYPAIDIEKSVSRVMSNVADPTHLEAARRFRQLNARHTKARDLIQLGAYAPGHDPDLRPTPAWNPCSMSHSVSFHT